MTEKECRKAEGEKLTSAWRVLGVLQQSVSDIRNFLVKQEKRRRANEKRGSGDRHGGGVAERRKRRGGGERGINAAQKCEPAAVKDVSPPCQDIGSRSARQPHGSDRHHGNGQGWAHLPTRDTSPADPRPVEPDQAADQQAAGKIITSYCAD